MLFSHLPNVAQSLYVSPAEQPHMHFERQPPALQVPDTPRPIPQPSQGPAEAAEDLSENAVLARLEPTGGYGLAGHAMAPEALRGWLVSTGKHAAYQQ